MFPHGFCFAGHMAAWRASDPAGSDRKASIAWTRVHAIARSNTCLKHIVSEIIAGPTLRHVDKSGALDLHQTEGVAITIITAIFAHLAADAHLNRGPRGRAIVAIRSPEA